MAFVFFILTGFFLFNVLQYYTRKTKGSSAGDNYIGVLLILSLFVLVITEFCSAFNCVRQQCIQWTWFACAGISAALWWRITKGKLFIFFRWKQLLQIHISLPAIIGSVTLFICLVAYPNNWDSMTYHLARVMHWLQNGNVNHYATHIVRQVSQPPLSEYFQMHFILLSGSDRFANLVQWMFMTGAVIASGRIALLLTGNTHIAKLSALLAALIPMGILQSSSTQNDMAVSFFILTALLFAVRAIQNCFNFRDVWLFSTVVALACLTKGTAYVFLLPAIAIYGVIAAVRLRLGIWKPLLTGLVIYFALNSFFLQRNYTTFHHPLAPDTTLQNAFIGIQTIATNLEKNLAMHFLTPWQALNRPVIAVTESYHHMIHTDVNDPRFNWQFSPPFRAAQLYPHEDYATAPLHVLLFCIACIFLLFTLGRHKWELLVFALAIAGMWVAFSMLLKWQVWHCRLHLPILLASTPLVAYFLYACRKYIRIIATGLCILVAAPSVFYNYSRPLFGNNSICTNSRFDQYFFNQPAIEQPFFQMSAIIQRNNLAHIGLLLSGDSWEYPMWMLLGDVEGLQMQHILVKNASGMYEDNNYIPDGIINKIQQPDSLNRIYYHNTAYRIVYENGSWMFMEKVEE